MTEIAHYRFLPWTRRGLVAELAQADAGAALPARPAVNVAITVTGAGLSSIDLHLYGPGDVIGIDPRLIVRLTPRANSTNVESNYFAAIEFDPPDFPWMFTPAKTGGQDRLRPWLVLIVVDQAVVARPRTEPRRPLPVLVVPAAVAAQELPNLTESWAWAHTQVVTSQTSGAAIESELAAKPNLNVSRLVCLRRLEPNKKYYACLVPAFDLGVQRGLGDEPAPNGTLQPAWNVASPGDVRLPVYFHWEFATGPEGDFESLARKLKPFICPDTVGFARLYLGQGGPELPEMPPDDPNAYTLMDGALRAPGAASGSLDDIPAQLQAGLQSALDAPAAQAQEGPADDTPALGPPIYGEWHVNQHTVPDNLPAWLRQLNLDPRSRVAAGLGAEVVRANQEDFMQACWEQIGKILQANELLNRARLAMETSRRLYERHFQTLPPDRLVQLTAPLHARTLHGDMTVRAGIARTSLPDASVDPALRRLTSPQRPMLKTFARRAGLDLPASNSFKSGLVKSLAAGRPDVDPNRFVPDGLLGVKALDKMQLPGGRNAMIDLSSIGLPIQAQAGVLHDIRTQGRELSRADFQKNPSQIDLRDNLRTSGLVTEDHLLQLGELEPLQPADPGQKLNLHQVLGGLVNTAMANPGAAAFLVTLNPRTAPSIDALDVDANGRVLVRTPVTKPSIPIATLEPSLFQSNRAALPRVLTDVKPGWLDRTGRRPITVEPGLAGWPQMRPPAIPGPVARPPSNTIPPLVKNIATISRFESAFRNVAQDVQMDTSPPLPVLVPFDIRTARSASRTLLARMDPIVMVPRRVRSMLALPAGMTGIDLAETFDRIMAAPDLPAATYAYLAKYDRTRFLPGMDEIPPNAITLLETNPRFIEAFMVGLNHEMNRELLWRAYPTDQRGTPFRHFWGWLDGKPDIEPIHTWRRNRNLGSNVRGAGQGGQIVLLVRGDLLHRYPNTLIYAWRAVTIGGQLKLKDPPDENTDLRTPAFAGQFDPDYTFVGFDLTDRQLLEGDGWFFVLQEQPTEPHFGFDEPEPGQPLPALTDWSNASWGHTGVHPGRHLLIAGNPLSGRTLKGVTFVTNAAHLAFITLQKPFRVVVHARHIVKL